MITVQGMSFNQTFKTLREYMRHADQVKTERWQGVKANTDTRELAMVNISVDLHGFEDLDHWRREVSPNLPWADDHFLERVGGEPLNPGVQWKNWPWGHSANKFRDATERFNHSYMERLWPKFARRTDDGRLPVTNPKYIRHYPTDDLRPKYGIGHHWGDLEDFVNLIAMEPYTRQAWIPLFFPEDTGVGDGGRKMCSLGYQVLVRDGKANLYYPLRSCDLRRHYSDDVYLAVRMLLWIIDRCRQRNNAAWSVITPGEFIMHCSSLHVFENDVDWLKEETK